MASSPEAPDPELDPPSAVPRPHDPAGAEARLRRPRSPAVSGPVPSDGALGSAHEALDTLRRRLRVAESDKEAAAVQLQATVVELEAVRHERDNLAGRLDALEKQHGGDLDAAHTRRDELLLAEQARTERLTAQLRAASEHNRRLAEQLRSLTFDNVGLRRQLMRAGGSAQTSERPRHIRHNRSSPTLELGEAAARFGRSASRPEPEARGRAPRHTPREFAAVVIESGPDSDERAD